MTGLMSQITGIAALVAVVVVAAVAYYGSKRRHERADALKAWAGRRGWQYLPQRDELADLLVGAPFGRGRGRQCRNLVRGRVGGQPLTVFDYCFVTTAAAGPSGQPGPDVFNRVQVLLVELPGPWPRLSASSHGLLSALKVSLGGQGVSTGQPTFDDRFRITTQDETFARRLFGPLTEAMLAHPEQGVEVETSTVAFYRPGVLSQADLEAWVDQLDSPLARLLGGTSAQGG